MYMYSRSGRRVTRMKRKETSPTALLHETTFSCNLQRNFVGSMRQVVKKTLHAANLRKVHWGNWVALPLNLATQIFVARHAAKHTFYYDVKQCCGSIIKRWQSRVITVSVILSLTLYSYSIRYSLVSLSMTLWRAKTVDFPTLSNTVNAKEAPLSSGASQSSRL